MQNIFRYIFVFTIMLMEGFVHSIYSASPFTQFVGSRLGKVYGGLIGAQAVYHVGKNEYDARQRELWATAQFKGAPPSYARDIAPFNTTLKRVGLDPEKIMLLYDNTLPAHHTHASVDKIILLSGRHALLTPLQRAETFNPIREATQSNLLHEAGHCVHQDARVGKMLTTGCYALAWGGGKLAWNMLPKKLCQWQPRSFVGVLGALGGIVLTNIVQNCVIANGELQYKKLAEVRADQFLIQHATGSHQLAVQAALYATECRILYDKEQQVSIDPKRDPKLLWQLLRSVHAGVNDEHPFSVDRLHAFYQASRAALAREREKLNHRSTAESRARVEEVAAYLEKISDLVVPLGINLKA